MPINKIIIALSLAMRRRAGLACGHTLPGIPARRGPRSVVKLRSNFLGHLNPLNTDSYRPSCFTNVGSNDLYARAYFYGKSDVLIMPHIIHLQCVAPALSPGAGRHGLRLAGKVSWGAS